MEVGWATITIDDPCFLQYFSELFDGVSSTGPHDNSGQHHDNH